MGSWRRPAPDRWPHPRTLDGSSNQDSKVTEHYGIGGEIQVSGVSEQAPDAADGWALHHRPLRWHVAAPVSAAHRSLRPGPEDRRVGSARLHRRLLAVATALRSSCLLYTSPSPRDGLLSRMPSSA